MKEPAPRSLAELLQLLAPQHSMAESYTFDVPASVATGLDAVILFASSAAKDGLIVFCNLNPEAKVSGASGRVHQGLRFNRRCAGKGHGSDQQTFSDPYARYAFLR
jgi:hypothetical protein